MPENEFEKKVQQQMEELRFSPDASVWLRVEAELKKKKKRRIAFFFLLLAGLALLGYPGYILFSKDDAPALVQQTAPPLPAPVSETKKTTAITDTHHNTKYHTPGPIQTKPVAAAPATGNSRIVARSGATGRTLTAKKKNQQPASDPETGNNRELITGKKNDPAIVSMTLQPERQATEETKAPAMKKDSLSTAIAGNKPGLQAPAVTGENEKDSLAEAIPKEHTDMVAAVKKKKTPAIRLGPELSAGITSNRNHIFSLNSPSYSADYNYSLPSSGSGNPLGSGISPPSAVKAGPSFKIGVVAELQLSRRSSFSAGLRYTYLSEKIKVGAYKDTSILSNSYQSGYSNVSIRGIYRGSQNESYTNRYHFIEIPLFYQWQINKGNKVRLLWNTGMSVSYLVATNALVYDTAAGGIYTHNRHALNKFQANIHTGLSFRFGNGAGLQWAVGPELSLGLTELMKQEPFIKKRYLLYGGITGRLLFPSLKK